MSRERARRRAEREAAALALAEQRRVEAERRARREARRQRLFGWLPRPGRRSGQSGLRAARKRRDAGLVVALVVTANLLVWLASDRWAMRAFFCLFSILIVPIVLNLVSRKK